jgi:hypothetical protein
LWGQRPQAKPLGRGKPEEKLRLAGIGGWKQACVGNEMYSSIYLATCDNYPLTRKNDSYHLVILHGLLWEGRFQGPGRERNLNIRREQSKFFRLKIEVMNQICRIFSELISS